MRGHHQPDLQHLLYTTKAKFRFQRNLSVRSIDRKVSNGDLPQPLRLGGSRRWNKTEVLEFLRNRQGGAAQEAGDT